LTLWMSHARRSLRDRRRGQNLASYMQVWYRARRLGMSTFYPWVPVRLQLGPSGSTRAPTPWMAQGVSTWDGTAVQSRRLSESSVVMACKAVVGAMAQLRSEAGPESG
jgi:hypothetical protein